MRRAHQIDRRESLDIVPQGNPATWDFSRTENRFGVTGLFGGFRRSMIDSSLSQDGVKVIFRTIIVMVLASVLCGCGPPTLDTTSADSMAKTLVDVRSKLSAGEKQAFDAALREQLDRADPTDPLSEQLIKADLHGLSAEQLVERAAGLRQQDVDEIDAEIVSLQQKKDALEAKHQARVESLLAGADLMEPKLTTHEGSFGSITLTFSAELANRADRSIAAINFDLELVSPDGEQLFEGPFRIRLPEPLEPGNATNVEAQTGASALRRAALSGEPYAVGAALVDVMDTDGEVYLSVFLDRDDCAQLKGAVSGIEVLTCERDQILEGGDRGSCRRDRFFSFEAPDLKECSNRW